MTFVCVNRFARRLLNAGAFFLLALAITVKPAAADNAFLLQLGMFDSEDQANQQWNEVKSKNTDLLGTLNLHIAEVSLPPDNKTTYRTQAGPLESREQAVKICNELLARSVKCYVVETAMFGNTPAENQSQAAVAKPAEAKPAAAPLHTITEEDTAHADDPDYIPPPVDSGPVIISSTGGAPVVPASASSPAELAEMPIAPTPAAPANPAPVQVAAAEPPTHAAAASAKKTSSNDEDEDDDVPAPVLKKNVTTLPAAPSSEHYVAGREPHFLDQEPQPTQAMAAATPPAMATAPVPPPAAPAEQPKEKPGFFSRLFGSSSEPAAPATPKSGVVGSVNVAEAVRVPLSSVNTPPARKIVPVMPGAYGAGSTPSSPTDKTLWAQVSYFRDEEQALTFYRQFAAAYPQFTDGVRIRITRPFGMRANAARVSLRVGPFLGTDDVRTICAVATRWSARCTVVRDIGASVAMNAAPDHAAQRSRAERARAEEAPQVTGKFWAQFGTYHSSLEAWDAWRELKATHRKIIGHMRPNVTTPPESSAKADAFRLRAGPFNTEERANAFCSKLQETSADCLVLSDH